MNTLQRIALVLTVIGALNWGLIGFFNFDLVAGIFGSQEAALSRIIYGIIGISGLFMIPLLFKPFDETEFENDKPVNRPLQYGTEFSEDNTLSGEHTENNNQQNQ